MRRKTIGRNPLDALAGAKPKGKRKAPLAAPEMRSEIREAILKKPAPKKSPVAQWLKSVLNRIAG